MRRGRASSGPTAVFCASFATCSNLNFVRPRNHGAPDQLVKQDNHRDHRSPSPKESLVLSPLLAAVMQERAQPGEGENRGLPKRTFRRPSGKTSRRQTDIHWSSTPGRWWKMAGQAQKPLPASEAVDTGDFLQITRDRFEGKELEAERDVPDLAREYQQNGAQLQADLAPREKRDHGEHHSRKKAQDRDGLQHVQQRHHNDFSAA